MYLPHFNLNPSVLFPLFIGVYEPRDLDPCGCCNLCECLEA